MSNQDAVATDLNYLANIVFQAFEKEHGNSPSYLEEKGERLAKPDKFHTLVFLFSCGDNIQSHVARAIGVTLEDLKTAIQVVGRC